MRALLLALALVLTSCAGSRPAAPYLASDTLIVVGPPEAATASGAREVAPVAEAFPDLTEAAPFTDREAILQTIKAFYIGDHTGSLEHKRASMHPQGAYRYVNDEGEYRESQFRLVEGGADTLYTEELLSIEIYEHVALARLRLENQRRGEAEYKLMTLHKTGDGWRITSIAWGWGITQ